MRKSKYLFTLLFIFLLFGANAQKFRSGIKGGFNFSTLYIDEVEDRQIRPGFHIGVFGQSPLSEAVALQTELLFTTAGNRSIYSTGPFDGEIDFNINYLQLPIMLNFKIADAFEIHVGPYAAYLIGANTSSEGDFGSSFSELDRDNFQNFDFGLASGVGFNLDDLQVGVRYNLGFNEIAKSTTAKDLMGDSKNVVGQLYIALGL